MNNIRPKIKWRKTNCFSSFERKKSSQKNGAFIDASFPRAYNPSDVETMWLSRWETKGALPEKNKNGKENVFTMVLPPPNVTGMLHVGHALTATIQDVLARWHRMCGKRVVWVPGTDHAGIATQVVVEKFLRKSRGVTRHELGKEAFLKEIWLWGEAKGNRIEHQLKRLAATLDWQRHTFTMDKSQNDAVVEAVIRLWEAGLMYRAEALVNWSCELCSAISDMEVEHVSISGPTELSVPGYSQPVTFGFLTDLAYRLADAEGEVVVSTTRVETMQGDVAVAVHPQDGRYAHLHGAQLWHPLRNCTIPVVTDETVDPHFGTGAVKVTPAHSHTDFEISKRHNLPVMPVISEDGFLNDMCGEFAGMKRFTGRNAIKVALQELGLYRGERGHTMQVPICSRSGDVVELIVKPQWFIRCQNIAARAAEAVRSGELVIDPERYNASWFSWLENCKDWCVSRQLWWGHQLPLYNCSGVDGESVWVAAHSHQEAEAKASQLVSSLLVGVTREQDVLDTWFSSALFPFTVFGWPQKTEDLASYYPLSLMVTGHDILNFWVARIVMLGTQLTGQLPFKKILLHGVICDSQGRKMSKSLGNVIDPEDVVNGVSLEGLRERVNDNMKAGLLREEEVAKVVTTQAKLLPNGIPQCGCDALRFTLLSQNIKNHYVQFNVTECNTHRLFCNKIWQASRFVSSGCAQLGLYGVDTSSPPGSHLHSLSLMDRWILSRLSCATDQIGTAMQNAQFYLATMALKQFLYNDFCDIYLESSKSVLRGIDIKAAECTCYTLLYCLNIALRLLAPFMPFLAEELYHQLPLLREHDSIADEAFPCNVHGRDASLEAKIQISLDILAAIRSMKQAHNLTKHKPTVLIVSDHAESLAHSVELLTNLGRCGEIRLSGDKSEELLCSVIGSVGGHSQIYISVEDLMLPVNTHREKQRKDELEKELKKLMKITSHPNFRRKASAESQRSKTEKMMQLRDELSQLQEC